MSRRVVPDEDRIWHALADPTRRAILDALRSGPRTTGTLACGFPTTRYTVMGHLDVLAEVGLITVERRGRERLNHLTAVPLREAYRRWVRPLAESAADTLLRLGEAAEERSAAMDVQAQHRVRADVARTWETVMDLPRWWPRRWSEGQRLVFEPVVGGRLGPANGEFDDGAEGELWGVVTALRPRRELVVDGAMGLAGPVLGQWRMILEPIGDETTVTLRHRVLGEVGDEDRDCYATGWVENLARLAAAAENR
ncbi:helix-turn-helix domain-containing protein [Allokutzneria sp. A3M-2-11 16]|uniref:helix-turn-helix domain-containing protein n=1 Tax=Allokutzneria sp. A3M-2-11 16 TaxID=2962043 RepID=UPI0020B7AA71|nr:helix-turn-helix domain-containing protein [Allokutzneria sp. A3M-2-11 16]MCP3802497.1 helix-turn-helix domain-containing protein [Allokutzneria sp. A3M-2-11 16]